MGNKTKILNKEEIKLFKTKLFNGSFQKMLWIVFFLFIYALLCSIHNPIACFFVMVKASNGCEKKSC